jgi:hypothetical protein
MDAILKLAFFLIILSIKKREKVYLDFKLINLQIIRIILSPIHIGYEYREREREIGSI